MDEDNEAENTDDLESAGPTELSPDEPVSDAGTDDTALPEESDSPEDTDPLDDLDDAEDSETKTQLILKHDDDDETKIIAQIEEAAEDIRANEFLIRGLLKDLECENYFIHDKNMRAAIEAQHQGKCCQLVIAEAVDAEVIMFITEDAMEAYVSITEPQGGQPISEMAVYDAISRSGVIEGLNHDAVKEAVAKAHEKGTVENFLIAEGLKPVQGDDALFECLVEQCLFKTPSEDDSGNVDFFDMQEFVVVDEGTELMRRSPPTTGTNGYDVHGHVIVAETGEDIQYRETVGTRICAEDSTLLISTKKGHPVIFVDGVDIDETLVLPKVDISTGNVTFDGSLHVKGDIGDGVTIDVTGDVVVEGVIQKAKVAAGGDILVKNGVIGGVVQQEEGTVNDDDEFEFPEHQYSANLIAVGDINARFIDNAFLQAGEIIAVKEYVRHCRLNAGNAVHLGKQGGKGQIIGGRTTATKEVEAKLIGTNADVHTLVEVGIPPELRARYDEIIKILDKKNEDMTGLVTTFAGLKIRAEDPKKFDERMQKTMVNAAKNIKAELEEIEIYSEEKVQLENKMESAGNAHVRVNTKAFPNAIIKVKDGYFKVKEETRSGTFVIKGKRVEME